MPSSSHLSNNPTFTNSAVAMNVVGTQAGSIQQGSIGGVSGLGSGMNNTRPPMN